jgi:hypothetical protein
MVPRTTSFVCGLTDLAYSEDTSENEFSWWRLRDACLMEIVVRASAEQSGCGRPPQVAKKTEGILGSEAESASGIPWRGIEVLHGPRRQSVAKVTEHHSSGIARKSQPVPRAAALSSWLS